MAKTVCVTFNMPARAHSKLRRQAAISGLTVDEAILQCIVQHKICFDAPERTVNSTVRPSEVWSNEWSARWQGIALSTN